MIPFIGLFRMLRQANIRAPSRRWSLPFRSSNNPKLRTMSAARFWSARCKTRCMASKPRAIIDESVRVRGIVLIAVGSVVSDQLHAIASAPANENVTAIVSVNVMEGNYQYKYCSLQTVINPPNICTPAAIGNVHAVASVSVRRRITTEMIGNLNSRFK